MTSSRQIPVNFSLEISFNLYKYCYFGMQFKWLAANAQIEMQLISISFYDLFVILPLTTLK